MSCDKHLLNVHWNQHDWERRVTATVNHVGQEVDMWGRPVVSEQVTCHITYVCRTCGAERDGAECGCDKHKGDACAPRLEYLDTRPETSAPADAAPIVG